MIAALALTVAAVSAGLIELARLTYQQHRFARLVHAGRRRKPPLSWDKLAAEISQKAGGPVNSEMLRGR